MYIAYPSGLMSYEIHPMSYRAVQTLLFHSAMVVYGLVTIVFDKEGLKIKKCYRDLAILGGMTVWALIGNTLYSGSAGDYDHDFNWFFIKQDPFYALPENIAPYVAPWLNLVAFFGVELIIYIVFIFIDRAVKKKSAALSEAKKEEINV
jgi:hypothetical protein